MRESRRPRRVIRASRKLLAKALRHRKSTRTARSLKPSNTLGRNWPRRKFCGKKRRRRLTKACRRDSWTKSRHRRRQSRPRLANENEGGKEQGESKDAGGTQTCRGICEEGSMDHRPICRAGFGFRLNVFHLFRDRCGSCGCNSNLE